MVKASAKKSGKKRRSEQASEGQSISHMIVWVVVAIAFVGWMAMASSYAHADIRDGVAVWTGGGGRSAGSRFWFAVMTQNVIQSVVQIPNVFSVLGWNFTHRPWLPIGIVVCQGLAVLGGFGLKRLEMQLDAERRD